MVFSFLIFNWCQPTTSLASKGALAPESPKRLLEIVPTFAVLSLLSQEMERLFRFQ